MMLETLRRLWEHVIWADGRILDALPADPAVLPEAVREAAHLIAAEEIWLGRLQQRPTTVPVWPNATLPEVKRLARDTHAGWRAYMDRLQESDLVSLVA